MVALNLTLLVELGLFLIFLWAMNAYVFRPLFKVMDARSAQIEEDKIVATTGAEEANTLEANYARDVSEIHRESSHQIVRAQRDAQRAHNQVVDDLKKKEELELRQLRKELDASVDQERQSFPDLTTAISRDIVRQLGLKGDMT
jgi:F-type H+-transporting ATPase subunit b